MKIGKYEIVAECIQERAEYKLNENGEITEFIQGIDSEPEIAYYGVYENGDCIGWFDTLEEVKEYCRGE